MFGISSSSPWCGDHWIYSGQLVVEETQKITSLHWRVQFHQSIEKMRRWAKVGRSMKKKIWLAKFRYPAMWEENWKCAGTSKNSEWRIDRTRSITRGRFGSRRTIFRGKIVISFGPCAVHGIAKNRSARPIVSGALTAASANRLIGFPDSLLRLSWELPKRHSILV